MKRKQPPPAQLREASPLCRSLVTGRSEALALLRTRPERPQACPLQQLTGLIWLLKLVVLRNWRRNRTFVDQTCQHGMQRIDIGCFSRSLFQWLALPCSCRRVDQPQPFCREGECGWSRVGQQLLPHRNLFGYGCVLGLGALGAFR